MDNLIAQGGAGGAGALFGTFLAFLGFKNRLDTQDKRIDVLADSVVYEDTFEATTEGFKEQLKTLNELSTEMRKDIKLLLRKKS